MSLTNSRRIPELDGIRGLAILLVVIYHYFAYFAAFPAGTLLARLAHSAHLFWAGVDLFFVLSGFLIGGILIDNKDSPNYFKVFYIRRFYRILPLYLLAVLANFAFGQKGDIPLWSYLTLTQNLWTAKTGSFGAAWLGVTWSLCIEEQFYLFAPLVIRILSRRGLIILCAMLIILAPVFRLIAYRTFGYAASYVLLPCRADALALGILSAIVVRSAWQEWLLKSRHLLFIAFIFLLAGFAYMTYEGYGIDTPRMIVLGYSLIAFLCCTLLLLFSKSRVFAFAPLRRLGVWAYGIYLFHIPILLMLSSGTKFANLNDLWLPLMAALTAITLAGASWHFFEKPLVGKGKRYRYW